MDESNFYIYCGHIAGYANSFEWVGQLMHLHFAHISCQRHLKLTPMRLTYLLLLAKRIFHNEQLLWEYYWKYRHETNMHIWHLSADELCRLRDVIKIHHWIKCHFVKRERKKWLILLIAIFTDKHIINKCSKRIQPCYTNIEVDWNDDGEKYHRNKVHNWQWDHSNFLYAYMQIRMLNQNHFYWIK